jgi:hypothetical protein
VRKEKEGEGGKREKEGEGGNRRVKEGERRGPRGGAWDAQGRRNTWEGEAREKGGRRKKGGRRRKEEEGGRRKKGGRREEGGSTHRRELSRGINSGMDLLYSKKL